MKSLPKIKLLGQKKMTTVIVALLLVVVVGLAVTLLLRGDTTPKPAPPIQSSQAHTVKSTLVFGQQVYDTYLKEWGAGETAFIKHHRDWFSESFLKTSIDLPKAQPGNSPFLFCNKVSNKPDSFVVTASGLSADKKSAVIYLNGSYQGKSEVTNLPVVLQATGGGWMIASRSCELI